MALKVTTNCFKQLITNHRLCRVLSYLANVPSIEKRISFSINKYFNSPFKIYAKLYSDEIQIGKDIGAIPKPKRKKTVETPQITIFDEKNIQMTTTLEQATKLAKARNFKLIQIKEATNGSKAVYELVPFSRLLSDDVEKKIIKKNRKHVAISSKITDHDLEIKIKNIKKILAKNYSVSVLISKEGNESNIKSIMNRIENGVKDVGIMDKKVTPKNPKFNINPVPAKQILDNNEPETPDMV